MLSPKKVDIESFEPKSQNTSWPIPSPLSDELLPVMAFRPDLLPESLRGFVMDISERMQCPPDFIATSLIVALGSIIGAKVGIRPKQKDSWQVQPNVWGMIIGNPGAMKSPAISEVLKPLKDLEAEANKENAEAMEQFSRACREFEMREKAYKKQAEESLKKNPDGEIPEFNSIAPKPPPQKRFIVNDATVEKLGEILADNPKGVLVFRDELMGLLNSLNREENTNARSFYLEAWNGDSSYSFDRITRGKTTINNLCVSMLGGTQPAKIAPYIKDAISGGKGDDGLLQRFSLMTWPDATSNYIYIDRYKNQDAYNLAFGIFEYLDKLDPFTEIDECEQAGDKSIPYLRFDDDAQSILVEYLTKLETDLRSGQLHHAIESHLSKFRKAIPALALIFHLCDKQQGKVSKSALLLAIKWHAYLLSHAERIFAAVTMTEKKAALAIFKKLKEQKLNNGFKLRDIQQKNWAGLSDKESLKSALSLLCDHDIIRLVIIQNENGLGGRPSEQYEINPHIYS